MIAAVIIYLVNKTFLTLFVPGQIGLFCRCYLNDLVCPLFFLGYCQILLIWAGLEMKSYKCMVILTMLAGCVWEFFAPIINPVAITDYWDLLCYFIGSSFFAIMYRKSLFKERQENR